MTIIVPCCGQSSRFKGLKKQFLTHPIGLPLPIYSVSGITGADETLFVFIEEEFNDRYVTARAFREQCSKVGIVNPDVCLLDKQTNNQVETIIAAINEAGLGKEPIFIKDCDNYFEAKAQKDCVCTIAANAGEFDLRNKSYSLGDPIETIRERQMISDRINVGGYGFSNGNMFKQFCTPNATNISHVIQAAINMAGEKFMQQDVKAYEDYGTLHDWLKYLRKYEGE